MAYIYIITNDINDKVYIGKTNFSIEKRFQEHCNDSTKHRKEKRPLYNAMRKYGIEHFHIKQIEEVSAEDASKRETYWINKFDSYNNGYNATLGGDGKTRLNYKKILNLFDTTSLSQTEIANQCHCSKDSVKNIVSEYRPNVNWIDRFSNRKVVNSLGISGLSVRCVETNLIFPSCTAAANWLIKNNKIKSQSYGRNSIPKVCRHERKTVGGYHWEFV